MNPQNQCDIARDLMPLSIDAVCSEGSQHFLEEHLQQCPPCQRIFSSMKSVPASVPAPALAEEDNSLRRGLKSVRRRFRWLWITLITFCCAFVLLLAAGGVQQMLMYWSAPVPLELYTVTHYRHDALFFMDLSAVFPQTAYNGVGWEETIVTTEDNHTGAEEAVIITYTIEYFPHQARAFVEALPAEMPQGFVSPQAGQTSVSANYRYSGGLPVDRMCVVDGHLYMIASREYVMTTYGRPLKLLTPGMPVSEIRFTDGENTITLYTWGDEIPNHSADRVDEYGVPQSGMISPSDYERFSDLIE